MTSVDASGLPNINDPSLDPTNPASPYYNPNLGLPTVAASITQDINSTTDSATTDVVALEKKIKHHRRGRRHLSQNQNNIQIPLITTEPIKTNTTHSQGPDSVSI